MLGSRVRSLLGAVRDWWNSHVLIDLPVAVLLGTAALLVPSKRDTLSNFATGVAAYSAVMLTVATLAINLYITGSGPRMQAVRQRAGSLNRSVWQAILRAAAIGGALPLLALLLVKDWPLVATVMTGTASALLALRTQRMFWLLSFYMRESDQDAVQTSNALRVIPPRGQRRA